ncbi:SDR family NAD(P)-dependent oxidoreductase [Paenibacillus sp. GCM10012307]|uniref:SDR family NAD(P)-dependent oxidoreductase n=1 Tax=Paenibacillus roseus TaxID=2798579 RepID=A0A934MTI8_9BACL|nr:SDR family NAD(P)-dependent oxidoreductase [Paenibacillus roseus]MBJ6360102.1 SDR family NAD(P)-dependent oxidoreductase [Paenibacillus roseus]
MNSKLAVIVGAGPGVGNHVAKKFGENGFRIVLISRNPNSLEQYVDELRALGIEAHGVAGDAGSTESLQAAFAQVKQHHGVTDVLVYNAAVLGGGKPTSLTAETLIRHLQVDVAGALTSALQVVPDQTERQDGTILFTGGALSLYPSANYASLSIGKAAMRNLALSLAEELSPQGIFVGTVTIAGQVKPGTNFDPARIAELYWDLYETREKHEIVFTGKE